MRLRTDDEIYRVRMVYLGPPGYTFPWQFTYGQYALMGALTGIWALVLSLVTRDVTLGVPFGFATALFMTAWISRRSNPDLTLLKVMKVTATDWRSFQSPPPAPLPRRSARHIRITTVRKGNRR
jgi:hypothetical protein